jgi:SulP family sulfate permease
LRLIKENIGPGITVALVAIPLSVALSIASGATPIMGLSTGIFAPCIAGIIGGSNYNILGTAGALANLINGLVSENGVEIVPLVAIVTGIFSGIVYFLKLEKYCMLIPVSVLEGFSLAVAIAIGGG